jgi:hypothetical protein
MRLISWTLQSGSEQYLCGKKQKDQMSVGLLGIYTLLLEYFGRFTYTK